MRTPKTSAKNRSLINALNEQHKQHLQRPTLTPAAVTRYQQKITAEEDGSAALGRFLAAICTAKEALDKVYLTGRLYQQTVHLTCLFPPPICFAKKLHNFPQLMPKK